MAGPPPAPSRALLLTGAAGAACGLAYLALTLGSDYVDDPGLEAALGLLVGWSFIGTGLFAWWREPENGTGRLMTAAGFAWFATGVEVANNDVLHTIGIALDGLFPALVGHLLLAFPAGRLQTRAERVVMAGGYINVTVLQIPALLFEDDPRSLLVVDPDQALSDLLDALQYAAALPVIVASIVILARRWSAAATLERRALAPVALAGGVAFAAFLLAKGFDAAGAQSDGLDRLSLVMLATVPFGFLAGLLRSLLAELVLENRRLTADLRNGIEELRASRARLLEAGDSERRRIERNLHDGAQARLVALAATLGRARLRAEGQPELAALLEESSAELKASTAELRELAQGIHPAVLSDRGLMPALEGLAARMPVPVHIEGDPGDDLPAPVATAVYFFVSEALTNVAKYAQASRAVVTVERDADRITASVDDDGIGGADPAKGSGLSGLADRVAALDGELDVHSPSGEGTRLRAAVPLPGDCHEHGDHFHHRA
jgi:signal transduction histidine kinase